jgi:hypothetical protein
MRAESHCPVNNRAENEDSSLIKSGVQTSIQSGRQRSRTKSEMRSTHPIIFRVDRCLNNPLIAIGVSKFRASKYFALFAGNPD